MAQAVILTSSCGLCSENTQHRACSFRPRHKTWPNHPPNFFIFYLTELHLPHNIHCFPASSVRSKQRCDPLKI